MKQLITFLLFLLIASYLFASDSLTTQRRIDDLERIVKQIDANQLNYRIEKDLLKETYSNNYEKINLVLTLVLVVIGILGFIGLRDISAIKKEYEQELSQLKTIQNQFDSKSKEFDFEKKKFDEELKSIIKENEEQSRKIKFIELKNKVRTLKKENQLTPALEFANVALSLNDSDTELLNQKGSILCRLNQTNEALETFLKARSVSPTDITTILNTAEMLYFAKDIDGAKKLIAEHKVLFESKENGKLLELFNLIELFHLDKKSELKEIAKSYITYENLKTTNNKLNSWNLTEAIYFIHHQPESEVKLIFQMILSYWNGQLTGANLLSTLKIEIPSNSEENE